jgi:hypothetical protein
MKPLAVVQNLRPSEKRTIGCSKATVTNICWKFRLVFKTSSNREYDVWRASQLFLYSGPAFRRSMFILQIAEKILNLCSMREIYSSQKTEPHIICCDLP